MTVYMCYTCCLALIFHSLQLLTDIYIIDGIDVIDFIEFYKFNDSIPRNYLSDFNETYTQSLYTNFQAILIFCKNVGIFKF